MNKHDVQNALDQGLSHLEFTARHQREVLSRARGEKTMKRKYSVGLVLAMVLLLFVIGAIAAVLRSGREFVAQELVPKVSESLSDQWTQEELEEILRIAGENGIVLSEDVLRRLQQERGTYKEELMRIFVKLDLGFYPASWPIEDQAWYEAMLAECGLLDVQTRFVPEGDEIPMEQALGIAAEYIKAKYGDPTDLTDESNYRRFVEYRQMIDGDVVIPRKWYIEYEARDLYHSSYTLTIATDGTVEEASCREGFDAKGEGNLTPSEIRDRYEMIYGGEYDWTGEIWRSFQRDVAPAMDGFEAPSQFFECVLAQTYLDPGAGMITKEAAMDAAVAEILRSRGMTGQAPEVQTWTSAVLLLDEETPVWKVVGRERNDEKELNIIHLVEINAVTAEVRSYDAKKNGFDYWYAPYVLARSLPVPEGPEEGVLPERFLDMISWAQSDMKDWTLEEKARYSSENTEAGSEMGVVYGMPAAGDMPEMEAVRMARDAIVSVNYLNAGMADRCDVSTWYDIGDPDNPVWLIVFCLDESVLDRFYVFVDARTQAVLDIWTPIKSNG